MKVLTRSHANKHIPSNYNIFVSHTLRNNYTQGQTTSDVTVDSLRLHCGTISFEVVAEGKQIK